MASLRMGLLVRHLTNSELRVERTAARQSSRWCEMLTGAGQIAKEGLLEGRASDGNDREPRERGRGSEL
jgi:hypothetical protein